MTKQDWRNGRRWVNKDYNEGIGFFVSFNSHYGSLEPTPEEIVWWNIVHKERKNSEDPQAQMYAYLAHPSLGKIIALTSLKRTEVLERERWWSVDGYGKRITLLKENPEMIDRWGKRLNVVRNIATRTLDCNHLSALELRTRKMDYVLRNKPYSESWDSVAWHSMFQNNEDVHALPYIGLVPVEEARQAIDSYIEDKTRVLKKEGRFD